MLKSLGKLIPARHAPEREMNPERMWRLSEVAHVGYVPHPFLESDDSVYLDPCWQKSGWRFAFITHVVKDVSVDKLWDPAPSSKCNFEVNEIAHLPETAQRYLKRAIAPGTRLASAVHIRMHGEIKLRWWLPFTAEEVINWDHGFIWAASARVCGLVIRGSDRLWDGEGAMRWKLAGILPMVTASGPNITRSAIGRLQAESLWLPSVLCSKNVTWTASDLLHAQARFTYLNVTRNLELRVDHDGRVKAAKLSRWANPGGDYRYLDFGLVSEEERCFQGYTIPSRIRAGWYFGSERFEQDGEFFRARVDYAEYR